MTNYIYMCLLCITFLLTPSADTPSISGKYSHYIFEYVSLTLTLRCEDLFRNKSSRQVGKRCQTMMKCSSLLQKYPVALSSGLCADHKFFHTNLGKPFIYSSLLSKQVHCHAGADSSLFSVPTKIRMPTLTFCASTNVSTIQRRPTYGCEGQ